MPSTPFASVSTMRLELSGDTRGDSNDEVLPSLSDNFLSPITALISFSVSLSCKNSGTFRDGPNLLFAARIPDHVIRTMSRNP